MNEKPKEIIEIEEYYNIVLAEGRWYDDNRYRCDNAGHVIELNLSKNQISDIRNLRIIETLNQLDELKINDNPFVSERNLKLSPGENHLNIIKNELEKFRKEEQPVKLPLKIMLLGNHASGKTSFLHYFLTGKVEKQKSTDILQIKPYYKEEGNEQLPDAIFYDFGGQDYYHGVYQLFFTETDKNTLLVIQTHSETDKQNNWKNSENDITQEFYISLKADERKTKDDLALQHLKQHLLDEIDKTQTEKRTRNEIDLYQYIYDYAKQENSHQAVNVSDLKNIYNMSMESLHGELHQLACRGMVMYYYDSEKENLKDVVWLNPAATVQDIHRKILNKEHIINNGRIKQDIFEKQFTDKRLLELLKQENVVFWDESQQEYIIPGYLPLADTEKNNELHWILLNFNTPAFVLKFERFIPFGLMNLLVCHYGKNPDTKCYYRDLLLFTHERLNAKVMIRLDFLHLEIFVYIACFNPEKNYNAEESAREILDDILYIYQGNIPFDPEIIYLEKDPESFQKRKYDHEFILDRYTSKKRENTPDDLYLSIDNENFVRLSLLDGVEKPVKEIVSYPRKIEEGRNVLDKYAGKTGNVYQYKHLSINENLCKLKKIFISYSKHDKDLMHEFDRHLRSMKEQGLVEVYYDELTGLGENIHHTIEKKLKECDYMVALVSVDYLNTDYIIDVELRLAKEFNKKLIPVILKPCDWENYIRLGDGDNKNNPIELSAIYAIGKGACITVFDDGREATLNERAARWKKVITELREKFK